MKRRWLLIFFAVTAAAQWAVPGIQILKSERILADGKPHRFRIRPVDPADLFRGRYVVVNVERNTVDLDHTPEADEFGRGRAMYVTLQDDAGGFAYPAAIGPTPPAAGECVRVRVQWADTTGHVRAEDVSDGRALLSRIFSEDDRICLAMRQGAIRMYGSDSAAAKQKLDAMTDGELRPLLAEALANTMQAMLDDQGGPAGEPYDRRRRRAAENVFGHFRGLIAPVPPARVTIAYPFDRYYAGEKSAPRIEGALQNRGAGRQLDAWVAVRVLGCDAVIEDLFVDGRPVREYLEALARGETHRAPENPSVPPR